MRTVMKLSLGLMLVGAMLGNTGCDQQPTAREKNQSVQRSLMERATAAYPVPTTTNFKAREAVVKQVERQDQAGMLFYVYILGQNGQQIGYYVANTRPIATCTLLTPPEERIGNSNGGYNVLKAPGLQGTYSPNPSCGSVFFFDAATDAYIEISGMSYFVSDQPLSVKSDPIKVIAK